MKKKYQNKTKLVNSDEVFENNVKLYCKLIADKTKRDTKIVRECFDKYFHFLDEIGVLNYIPQNRINKNIKTMVVNHHKVISNAAAYYLGGEDNSINIRANLSLSDFHCIVHEFNHLLTSIIKIPQVDTKNQIISTQNVGFHKVNYFCNKPIITKTLNYFSLNEICEYVEKFKILNDEDYEAAADWSWAITEDEIYKYKYKNCTKKNYSKEKALEELKDTFSKKIKNHYFLILSKDTIMEVGKINKDKFFVLEYKNNKYVKNNHEGTFVGINEGATEFLTCLFLAKYYGKEIITYYYINEPKIAEMIYKIFGNSFFEGYFSNTFKPMEKYLNLEEESILKIAEKLDFLHKNRNLSKKESSEKLVSLSSDLISLLSQKIAKSAIENKDIIESKKQIYNMIENSILEFAKSIYFGVNFWQVKYDFKKEIKSKLASSFNETIKLIKENIEKETIKDERFEKIVNSLTEKTEDQEKELLKNIETLNDNFYYFYEPNTKEIVPIEYRDGKEFSLKDDFKQEYIRNSIRYRNYHRTVFKKVKDTNRYFENKHLQDSLKEKN